MSPKVFLVLGLVVAASVLLVSEVAAVDLVVKTTDASTFAHTDSSKDAVQQDSCYYCGYINVNSCKCCVSSGKSGQKTMVDQIMSTASPGKKAAGAPADSCYYCGYIYLNKCKCCVSSA